MTSEWVPPPQQQVHVLNFMGSNLIFHPRDIESSTQSIEMAASNSPATSTQLHPHQHQHPRHQEGAESGWCVSSCSTATTSGLDVTDEINGVSGRHVSNFGIPPLHAPNWPTSDFYGPIGNNGNLAADGPALLDLFLSQFNP